MSAAAPARPLAAPGQGAGFANFFSQKVAPATPEEAGAFADRFFRRALFETAQLFRLKRVAVVAPLGRGGEHVSFGAKLGSLGPQPADLRCEHIDVRFDNPALYSSGDPQRVSIFLPCSGVRSGQVCITMEADEGASAGGDEKAWRVWRIQCSDHTIWEDVGKGSFVDGSHARFTAPASSVERQVVSADLRIPSPGLEFGTLLNRLCNLTPAAFEALPGAEAAE